MAQLLVGYYLTEHTPDISADSCLAAINGVFKRGRRWRALCASPDTCHAVPDAWTLEDVISAPLPYVAVLFQGKFYALSYDKAAIMALAAHENGRDGWVIFRS